MRGKLLLIYTGGTIGMKRGTDGSLVPFDFSTLREHIPELDLLPYDIDFRNFDEPIDSSDITPAHWNLLADIIHENYDDYEGFVVLHGTDTMTYSASALSFMLENLSKPVVFTGSQLPIGDLRTDAKENIITALEIAGSEIDRRPAVPEVSIYFEYQLMRGNRTVKVSSEHFNAFQSPNYPVLAEAGIHIEFFPERILPYRQGIFHTFKNMSDEVILIKLFPGLKPDFFEKLFDNPGFKAVILETFGSGNAPRLAWLDRILRDAVDLGIKIVNVTQCLEGAVYPENYATGRHLSEAGVISGKDLTTEAALAKVSYLLGKNLSDKRFREAFSVSLRGELTE